MQVTTRTYPLHSTKEVLKLHFNNGTGATVATIDGVVYLLTVLPQATYLKLQKQISSEYRLFNYVGINNFYYLGKELPLLLENTSDETIYELIKSTYLDLFYIKCEIALMSLESNVNHTGVMVP